MTQVYKLRQTNVDNGNIHLYIYECQKYVTEEFTLYLKSKEAEKKRDALGNCIYLSDEPDVIKSKIMSMYTDPTHIRKEDPGHTKGNPVFTYLEAFCNPEHFKEFMPDYKNLDELKAHYERGGLGDVTVKKFLNNVMQKELEIIRERRKMWEQRLPDVYDILYQGSMKAKTVAANTLEEVKHSMKIDYFENKNLLSKENER